MVRTAKTVKMPEPTGVDKVVSSWKRAMMEAGCLAKLWR